MDGKLQDYITFYLTGRINGEDLEPLGPGLRPVAFAPFSDLASLRYDFPLVLNRGAGPERALLSLSFLVDEAVKTLAGNPDKDKIARHGYAIEGELRRGMKDSGSGGLYELWHDASARLADDRGDDLNDSAKHLWNAFDADGEVIDADPRLAFRVIRHLWDAVQAEKADGFKSRAERLLMKLRNILEAETAGSAVGRAPEALRAGVGSAFTGAFDFDALSRVLVDSKPGSAISDERRERVKDLIGVIENQRFFSLERDGKQTYRFSFESSSEALKTYTERHTEAVELARTLKVAEIEAAGEYRETVHDRIFGGFGANGLGAEELAELPDYLVCAETGKLDAQQTEELIEMLAAGIPLKVLVLTDDVLEPSRVSDGHSAFGVRARQLVDTSIGLTDVFVLQTAVSGLFKNRNAILRGLSYGGPALFSVFSGAREKADDMPAYIAAAAASEARAFPTLVFDPSAGNDWASRLDIDGNPDPEDDWPVHTIACEDDSLQASLMSTPFTLADLMATDGRFFKHFALLNGDTDDERLVELQELDDDDLSGLPERVPYINLIDDKNCLRRAIVDHQTILETRRCLSMWRSLQELGGIHNSHAERALLKEREERALEARPESAAPAVAESPKEMAAPVAEVAESEEPATETASGEPYIETARCTTCNECTQINSKMFAYDENKQAYIADPDAGTFRELVEAAESCQVGIIHPGEPRNPKEPGLEDLIKRAADFR
jgi:hypothetical protein